MIIAAPALDPVQWAKAINAIAGGPAGTAGMVLLALGIVAWAVVHVARARARK